MWSKIMETDIGKEFASWLLKTYSIEYWYACLGQAESYVNKFVLEDKKLPETISNNLAIEWFNKEKKIFVDVSCNLFINSSDFGIYNLSINDLNTGDSLSCYSNVSGDYFEAIAQGVKKAFELLTE